MTARLLPWRTVERLARRRADPIPQEALRVATKIVGAVRARGEEAVRQYAERLGEIEPGAELYRGPEKLERAWRDLESESRERLARVAERVRAFATAQREAIRDVAVPVPGGSAGHTLVPMARAGCYAPGGRYPLPSSVLMTVVAARAAGVPDVWVASPRPAPLTLAAAHAAGADGVLAVGGAQAIAALAFGIGPIAQRDIIVGPGNFYVTAAKQLVSDRTAIDMLAGPSELVVLADGGADPQLVAADLLAQAEHDPAAVPVLITTQPDLVERVERALGEQLVTLPTADVARRALRNGGAVAVEDLAAGIDACNRLAPEHLELALADAAAVAPQLDNFGTLFVGAESAEVLGDYGAGPNHVLPTGGTARFRAGLSVFTFLRAQTWLRIDDAVAASELARDAAWFGRAEGLEAHARAAELRE